MPTTKASRTLLVVEDNQVEREGLVALLQNDGYNVSSAPNGREALRCLQADPQPDLLLMDMLMPDQDGWQFLRQLQQKSNLASVPVIIVTGLNSASPEWALSLGAAGLIRKPVDVEQLHKQIDRVLEAD